MMTWLRRIVVGTAVLCFLFVAFVAFVIVDELLTFGRGIYIVWHGGLGWLLFLFDVAPRIQANASMIATFALLLALLTVGAHFFMNALLRTPQEPERRWHWRWTGAGLAALMLLFTTGVAAAGATFQSTRLASDPEPWIENRRHRIEESWETRDIVEALPMGASPNQIREYVTALAVRSQFVHPILAEGPDGNPAVLLLTDRVPDSRDYLTLCPLNSVNGKRVSDYQPASKRDALLMEIASTGTTAGIEEEKRKVGLESAEKAAN